jgi:CBS domain-containing protein
MRVEEVMTQDALRPETAIHEAALMVTHGVSELPVVHDTGRVVGIVSAVSLLV